MLLTGLLDDGVAGLAAIKRCGGLTVVQDPDDALHPDMPRNALRHVEIDYTLPIHRMGALLHRLVHQAPGDAPPVPEDVQIEAHMAAQIRSDATGDNRIGAPAPYSCPECGGPLWQIDDAQIRRYRCHVGHAFTARSLLSDQTEEVERALWVALRLLEERANMLDEMAKDAQRGNWGLSAEDLTRRAAESRAHADTLRPLLLYNGQ